MLLEGRVCIVSGAASRRGLGRAIATLFAAEGASVALTDIDGPGAEAAAGTLPGVGHLGLSCDVTARADCVQATRFVLARFGRIDVLVNNAGITSPQRLMSIDDPTYDRVMDVNMRGTLNMTQAVVPTMRSQGSGSIVNMSSVSAQRGGGVFGGAHYSAAKAAILGFTKASARELAPEGIRVNALCPGFIDTDITGGSLTSGQMQAILASIPMGRAGRAEDVAGCALFLASDLSAFCTGTEIDPNGGAHIH
jgi:NAD(P)-dependent dehydrogenase (short-subunit alcohol dehydrogenase family)